MNPIHLLIAPIAFLFAQWLHEIVHIVAVRIVDGSVRDVSLYPETYVHFAVETHWQERVVLYAPAVVGFATLPVLFGRWSGNVTVISGVVAISWWIFTLNGGEGELGIRSLQAALARRKTDDHNPDPHPEKREFPNN